MKIKSLLITGAVAAAFMAPEHSMAQPKPRPDKPDMEDAKEGGRVRPKIDREKIKETLNEGPRGPKESRARGGQRDHRGPGSRAQGVQRDDRGPGSRARGVQRNNRGPKGSRAQGVQRDDRGPKGSRAQGVQRNNRGPKGSRAQGVQRDHRGSRAR